MILPCLASPRRLLQAALARSALVLTGVAGTLLAFLAMLFTWTPHPATLVQGVQGRYLLVPAMLLLLAVCSWEPAVQPWRQRLRWALLYVLGGVSMVVSVHRLLYAYYVQPAVALPSAVQAEPGALMRSVRSPTEKSISPSRSVTTTALGEACSVSSSRRRR